LHKIENAVLLAGALFFYVPAGTNYFKASTLASAGAYFIPLRSANCFHFLKNSPASFFEIFFLRWLRITKP
jgi:hypothetical protein